jgi:hypothetical protein
MRKITNINITNAELESFSVTMGEEKPEVSATISLKTDGGKKITSYSISTDSYREDSKFEIPISLINPILKIAAVLEEIIAEHCENTTKKLNQSND